ncbi:hypothetical protein BDW66DRAFT_149885 [Aspergillus desertorum]
MHGNVVVFVVRQQTNRTDIIQFINSLPGLESHYSPLPAHLPHFLVADAADHAGPAGSGPADLAALEAASRNPILAETPTEPFLFAGGVLVVAFVVPVPVPAAPADHSGRPVLTARADCLVLTVLDAPAVSGAAALAADAPAHDALARPFAPPHAFAPSSLRIYSSCCPAAHGTPDVLARIYIVAKLWAQMDVAILVHGE